MASASKNNMILSGNSKVDGVYHTAEWLLSAFASTLVFIVFVMQVYRIPTGSMAETLRGAHYRICCQQCGYQYDHDFIHRNYAPRNATVDRPLSNTVTPSEPKVIGPRSPRCPSCGYAIVNPVKKGNIRGRYHDYIRQGDQMLPVAKHTVFKGDQIFVQKCIYQFFQPKRWDVIVFKNPTEPRINYIKRCIGLPGETLQIFDGDIYANGEIQRKPDNVQEELWMVIYDNDYQPTHPDVKQFNARSWKQPFEKVGSSKWNLSANGPTVFSLEADSQVVQRIQYNDKQGNDFKATYGYDDVASYPYMPVCSDLMVSYYVDMQTDSAAGAQIKKYGVTYQGWVDADGDMQIFRLTPGGQPITIAEGQCRADDLQKTARLRFATVDHQVVLEYGNTKLVHDLGTGFDDAGKNQKVNPQVQILGRGTLQLTHIGLYRDIHYISRNILQAGKDKPMVLNEDEYFACGDNSPASFDSRLWKTEGLANNGKTYPIGVVPKDYMVGKAMVVHWPGGYRLKQEPLRWIPFVDGFKIIYGGKDSSNN